MNTDKDRIEELEKELNRTKEELECVSEDLNFVSKERDNLQEDNNKLVEWIFHNHKMKELPPDQCIWNLSDYLKRFIGYKIKQFYESERHGIPGKFIDTLTGTYDPDPKRISYEELSERWDKTLKFIWETLLEEDPSDYDGDFEDFIVKHKDYVERQNRAMELYCKYYNDLWD